LSIDRSRFLVVLSDLRFGWRLEVRWRLLEIVKTEIVIGLSQFVEGIHGRLLLGLLGRSLLSFLLLGLFVELLSSSLLFLLKHLFLQFYLICLLFFNGSKIIFVKHGFFILVVIMRWSLVLGLHHASTSEGSLERSLLLSSHGLIE
jgi:hypothetical protein